MRVIHTYGDKDGIIWKELLYTQYLSAVLAKKHYGDIVFYGDEQTSKMVKELGLPYSEVNDTILKTTDSKTWSVPKIKVFMDQKEPFVHIDTDTLLFDKIDFSSYDKDYLFSHRDMDIPNADSISKTDILKNLYMTWFFNLPETNHNVPKNQKYPFKEFVKDFKEQVPNNILKSGKEAYKDYYYYNHTYTNLFFDLLENIGEDMFNDLNFKTVPNMNVVYVRNNEKFSLSCKESLKHYEENKNRIDKEEYGSCYIEQFMIHTQLRFIDKKYKKSSDKMKNFIFPSLPLMQLDNHNNTPLIENVKFPLRLQYSNGKHFSCACCGEGVISALTKYSNVLNHDMYSLDSLDEENVEEFFRNEFNGFLHLTYLKWYDIFQAYIIDRLRKEVGDNKIREIHGYFRKIYPSKNLATKSTGEKLYTKLTGFKFTDDEEVDLSII